jgi:hypothetical protein
VSEATSRVADATAAAAGRGGWRRGRGRGRRYSGSRQRNTRRVECRQSIPTAAALMLASLRAAGRRDLAFGVLLVALITRGCCRVLQARGAASTCGAMQPDHVRRPAGVWRPASTAFTRCRDCTLCRSQKTISPSLNSLKPRAAAALPGVVPLLAEVVRVTRCARRGLHCLAALSQPGRDARHRQGEGFHRVRSGRWRSRLIVIEHNLP